MAELTMKKNLSGKMELTLTTLSRDPDLTKSLSKYNLRMFVANDGVYLGTEPVSDESYIECNIHTKRKDVIDYIITDTSSFSVTVNVSGKGKKAKYSSVEYYDKEKHKQRTTKNESLVNNGFKEKVKGLVYRMKK